MVVKLLIPMLNGHILELDEWDQAILHMYVCTTDICVVTDVEAAECSQMVLAVSSAFSNLSFREEQ